MEPRSATLSLDAQAILESMGDAFYALDAEWRIVNDVLGNVTPVYKYAPGSWGPTEAARLIGNDGPWLNPTATGDSI